MTRIAAFLMTDCKSGGEFQYVKTIMEFFKTTPKEKYEVICFCGNDEWLRWCRKNNMKCIRCRPESTPSWITTIDWWICRKAPTCIAEAINRIKGVIEYNGRLLRKEKINLYIVPSGNFISFYHIPSIRMEHDLMHRYEEKFEEVSEDYIRREALYISMRRFTSTIVVDSKLGKHQFIESYRKYANSKLNISILPYTAPKRELNEDMVSLPTTLPAKYIFYPAQFWKHKNHLNLLRAVKILRDEGINIKLVLVGSEKNGSSAVKKYIHENNLSSHVMILGFVNDDTIIWLYQHAQALVMPTYFGPTNIPPLEAMTYGCPVAVSNNYAMPEQIGKAGLYFNPDNANEIADAIKIVWTDEEKRKEMIQLGKSRMKQWNDEKFQKRFGDILNQTIITCCKRR